MLAWSQPSAFKRTGSQVGTKPGAGLELLAESWEAAVPSVLYTLSHILALRVHGLDFPGLDSFSGSLRCLPVIHLPPCLGAFPTVLSLSHFTALPCHRLSHQQMSAGTSGERMGDDVCQAP